MATKTSEVKIELKPIQIKEAIITIRGTTPLIVNNFSEKSKQQILDAQMKKTKTKEIRNPIEDFMRASYWITEMPESFTKEAFDEAVKNGAKFGFPSKGIKASIASGAYRNGYTKDKVSLYGAFLIPEEYITIDCESIEMREDYVRLPHNGTDVRFRPQFNNWSMTFTIQYNENTYSLDQLINYINLGGFSVGLGEMRVEKGSNFGAYEVVTTK